MNIAISPCPNDTFLFHAWISGLIENIKPPEVLFADIQHLNELALAHAYPLIKVSFGCFAKIVECYQLLPIGSALGFNCGPKIIADHFFSIADLPYKKIAIPGKETTSHYLLERFFPPPKEKIFCLYHEIPTLLRSKQADCGLIIHESRFTFSQFGFMEIADLGELWHCQKQAPLPLGGIAISRKLSKSDKQKVLCALQQSLYHAQKYPTQALPFVLAKAQEKNIAVVNKHIETYVNQETEMMSQAGMQAIEMLLDFKLPKDWIFLG